MANTLASAFDLIPFDSTLSDDTVDAAVADIRGEAGWHIAPVVTETISVYSHQNAYPSPGYAWVDPAFGPRALPVGRRELFLPSRKVVTVSAVRSGSLTLSGWEQRSPRMLYLASGWPWGALDVDLTHGFDVCPADLLPVIAQRAARARPRQAVQAAAIGGVSLTYDGGGQGLIPPRYVLYGIA